MTDQHTDVPATPADGTPEPGGPSDAAKRRRGWLLFSVSLVVAVLAGAGVAVAFAAIRSHDNNQMARPTGVPAAISDDQINLMGLSPVPSLPAPGFTLTDQNGKTLSLASLRGKAVVLEFMDPHCTDICPIVSAEYVDAYHDLGALASKVVFAAINVNQYHAGVADMLAYSTEHQLTSIPDWHFFTGSTSALQASWRNYDVNVVAPNPNADIVHTSVVYFIDPSGHERYVASPMVDHTSSGGSYLPTGQITGWGQGISQVVRTMIG